jgi:hypothetical protein
VESCASSVGSAPLAERRRGRGDKRPVVVGRGGASVAGDWRGGEAQAPPADEGGKAVIRPRWQGYYRSTVPVVYSAWASGGTVHYLYCTTVGGRQGRLVRGLGAGGLPIECSSAVAS